MERLIRQISRARQSANPADVQRLVAEILRAAQITAVEEYKEAKDRGVDFAVWSDSLQSSLGNPILIEVKATKLNDMVSPPSASVIACRSSGVSHSPSASREAGCQSRPLLPEGYLAACYRQFRGWRLGTTLAKHSRLS